MLLRRRSQENSVEEMKSVNGFLEARANSISHAGHRNTQRIRHLRQLSRVDLDEMGREMR